MFETFMIEPCPQWVGWVGREPAFSPGVKAVLMHLGSYMSPSGCMDWPGVGRLSEEVGCTEAQGKKALELGKQEGYLKVYKDMSKGLLAYVPCLPGSAPGGFQAGGPGIVLKADETLSWRLVALALADRCCKKCGEPVTIIEDVLKAVTEEPREPQAPGQGQ